MRRGLLLLLGSFALSACGEPEPVGASAKINSFTAVPATIELGDEVTLLWDTTGNNGISIEPRVGLQLPKGEAVDRPLVDTRYVLTIPGRDDLSAEVTVEVRSGPRVISFEATPRSISDGESAILSWVTSDAEGVAIEPGLGDGGPSGSVTVTPAATTTYRLFAFRGDQLSAPSELTVSVQSGNQPQIRVFRASPDTVQSGTASTLSWEVLNATSVSIDNGLGPQAAQGSVTVTPAQTTNYTLTAVGPGGQVNASVMVTVTGAGPPAVLDFSATPDTIAPGGASTLAWDTDNADEVEIQPGSGARLEAKGMLEVSPAVSTTYTLTAYSLGAGLSASRQVTVNVAAPNQPVVTNFGAQPAAITSGGSTTLTWSTQNTDTVDIDQGVGVNLGANGSVQVSPGQTTTYTLTARGPGGSANATTLVTVSPPPPVIDGFSAQPAAITAGGSTTLSWTTSHATSVTIDNGVGSRGPDDNVTVSPSQTTTYTLVAQGPGGSVSGTVVVSVSPPGAPTITSFAAAPPQIPAGGQATLSWSVQNATTVTVDNGLGAQAATGQVMVSPPSTTNYTLTAVGPGGTATAQATVTVITLGDTCNDALVIAGSGTFTGNTLTGANDYQATNSCTGFASTGPDLVYRLSLQAGDRLQASLQPTNGSWDTVLYLLTGCADVAASCLTGQDNGNPEEIDYTVLTTGDYFLVVDGFGGGGGSYSLAVNIGAAPIGNDLCQGATMVGSGGSFSGDTRNASHQYTPIASGFGGCTGYPATGNDVVYQVTLAAGERLQASLDATWDSALYLVRDCAMPGASCVAGQDNGNPEQIDFTAAQAGTYFLIVDGYNSAARGTYGLTVSVSPAVSGGETCLAPIAVPPGGGAFQSTTVGLANDYAPPLACTGFANAGPDAVYAVAVEAGDVIEAVADFPAHDGALYAVSECGSYLNCVGSDDGISGEAEVIRSVARASGSSYLVVDAELAGVAGAHDLTVARYTGETCAAAAPLLADGTSEWTTTVGKANDYSPNTSGCTGRAAAGPDRVYSRAMLAGDQLDLSFTPDGFDGAVYLVNNCADIQGSCVAGSDQVGTGAERIAPVFQQAGTAYVIVDGAAGAAGTGQVSARVRRGDTCADAYVVPGNGGTFRGTTTGYGANYGTTQSGGSCTGFSQTGADVVYAITLQPGQRLDASVSTTWDAALYLISNCAQSATTCLAGQDNGNPESIQYTNAGATPATYYLVVDAWQPSSGAVIREGVYTLTITLQ